MKVKILSVFLVVCLMVGIMSEFTLQTSAMKSDKGTVTRTTTLDLTSTTLSYVATSGEIKTGVDATKVSISDSSEGWKWAYDTKTLTLNRANIQIANGGSGDSYGIKLPAGTAIIIENQSVNTVKAADVTNGSSYAIYFDSSSDSTNIINGAGTLFATGGSAAQSSYGVYSDGASNINIESGIIQATGGTATYSYGIGTSAGQMSIFGGTVAATGGSATEISSGIVSGNGILVRDGKLTAVGGDANSESYGMCSLTNDVTIKGGEVTAIGGSSANISECIYAARDCIFEGGISIANCASTTGSAIKAENLISYIDTSVIAGDVNTDYAVIAPTIGTTYVNTTSAAIDLTNCDKDCSDIAAGWAWQQSTATLTLSGVNINTTTGSGIILPADSTIYLEEGSVNIVKSGNVASGNSYGIYCGTGDMTIDGPGKLFSISGTAYTAGSRSCGIYADDGMITVGKSGSPIVTAIGGTASGLGTKSAGIYSDGGDIAIGESCNPIITAIGGTAAESAGIFTSGTGNITISNGTITAVSGTSSIQSAGIISSGNGTVIISDGTVNSIGGTAGLYSVGIGIGVEGNFIVGKDGSPVIAAIGGISGKESLGIWSYNTTIGGADTYVATIAGTAKGYSFGVYTEEISFNDGTTYLSSGVAGTLSLPLYSGPISFGTPANTYISSPQNGIVYKHPAADGYLIISPYGYPAQNVLIQPLDKADIADAKAALDETSFTYATGEDKNNVKSNVTLPVTGKNGTTISWAEKTDAADNIVITDNIISVTRPSYSAGDKTVTITATISKKNSVTDTKDLTLVIKALNKSSDSSNNNGGNSGTNPGNGSEISVDTGILINGRTENLATSDTTSLEGWKVTKITIDDTKLQKSLENENFGTKVTISSINDSNAVIGAMNGQTVKDMQTKNAVLEMKTENSTYILPASKINIDDISARIGNQVQLKDITVTLSISESSKVKVSIVEDTANRNNYKIIVKPVDFEITCTSGDKKINVSEFNGYVERMIAIPNGMDASKITTGVVLNNDGTFSHVPTKIINIDGRYYAKIDSMTNSTYSVIYNPKEFPDVKNHWAKNVINDIGSRLIIGGAPDGNYNPDSDITRAEFSSIIVRALALATKNGESNFKDVTDSDWYSGYIRTAASYGIITGYGDGKIGPNDKITREQAMTMIAKAMKLTGINTTLKDNEVSALFASYKDSSVVSDYAKQSIATCLKAGIVSGRGGNMIAPKNYISRAEVAVMIQKLLYKSDLI